MLTTWWATTLAYRKGDFSSWLVAGPVKEKALKLAHSQVRSRSKGKTVIGVLVLV